MHVHLIRNRVKNKTIWQKDYTRDIEGRKCSGIEQQAIVSLTESYELIRVRRRCEERRLDVGEDDQDEASVAMTLYDVERKKDGSAERQRPRQTRKGNVSSAQILLPPLPPPPTASPRFNMLTLRWIGEKENAGDGTEEKEP